MSLSNFAVYSNPNDMITKYPKDKIQKIQKRISRLSKGRSRKYAGSFKNGIPHSKSYDKSTLRINKLYKRITNISHDYIHKESCRISNMYGAVVVEDIDLRQMGERKPGYLKFGKSISTNNFGFFRSCLEYKMKRTGGYFVKADKYYPSTQLCSKCGYQNHELKNIEIKKWVCPKCNEKHDRDINAAINLRNYVLTSKMSA